MELPLPDFDATQCLGAALATMLRPGDAILLEGPLGAGKSALARAIIRAALCHPALDVPSPSFTLVQSYQGPRLTLHHLDLWRLDGPSALHELGWEEMREDVVLVEWPDRLGPLRPSNPLLIALAPGPLPHARQATFIGWDKQRLANLAALSHVANQNPEGAS